ncbi:hypothetical protein M9H77_29586 [Catharanthus roseus]|uniref:Uncharacterized protein n=1 Tax=Catharanthus roseus TaxID=4058 RepID=A0ACB9ZVL9_CATRO|nr:hypothetical protein M9H77_29586 [Catharanthus roseus]
MDRRIEDIAPLAHESGISNVVDLIGGYDNNVEEDDQFINDEMEHSISASSMTTHFTLTPGVILISPITQHQLITSRPTITHGALLLVGPSTSSSCHPGLRHCLSLFGPSPSLVVLDYLLLELRRLSLHKCSVATMQFRLIFQSHLDAPYDSWTTLPQIVLDMWFAEFSIRAEGFDAIAVKPYRPLMQNMRIASKKPLWIP